MWFYAFKHNCCTRQLLIAAVYIVHRHIQASCSVKRAEFWTCEIVLLLGVEHTFSNFIEKEKTAGVEEKLENFPAKQK